MRKRILWILAACTLLAALAGCSVFLSLPLSITPAVQTVAIDDAMGSAVATWAVSGKGIVKVDYGDGQKETMEIKAGDARTIEHTYARIGSYTIRFTQGRTLVAVSLIVECVLPKVAAPFYLDALVEKGERVTFNFSRRNVGCDNGMTVYFSGIEPGDGTTEFRVTAYYADGPISVFDDSGRNVWGEWIALGIDAKDLHLLTVWAGWGGNEPLIPMGTVVGRGAEVAPLDCSGTCPEDPWIPPEIPNDASYMTFTLTVRNQYMGPEHYIAVSWRIAVQSGVCG